MGTTNKLRILFLAAEATPFVKVGGLGDVAGALPQTLRSLSNDSNYLRLTEEKEDQIEIDIRLVIPFHRSIHVDDYEINYLTNFDIPSSMGSHSAEVFETSYNSLQVYLISGEPILDGEQVYSQNPSDDGFKYTFFSLASLELVKKINWVPDVLHANDWHTSPAVYALNFDQQRGGFFRGTVSLLGIHNLPYLGVGAGSALRLFGLPPATGSDLPVWAQDIPLPLGLLSADHIVTVSPTYAREILTPEFGAGLDNFLRGRRDSISGILNGIDIEQWNPETDQFIPSNYQQKSIRKKQINKTSLLKDYGLSLDDKKPLLAMVTRLDYQKGVDLALDALLNLLDQNWITIILGTGDPALEQRTLELEKEFPGRFRSVIGFNNPLSHQIYAGADMLLIPSRYEPCGLTQMIAMRYGTVPIGHTTGGLKDTILDYEKDAGSTGFLFKSANSQALRNAIKRAIHTYQDQRRWKGLQRRGMGQNFSWSASAQKYLALYRQLVFENR